jgi:hypothetical protein
LQALFITAKTLPVATTTTVVSTTNMVFTGNLAIAGPRRLKANRAADEPKLNDIAVRLDPSVDQQGLSTSVFCFRLIAADIAELPRPLDEAMLAVRTFRTARLLVA